MKNKEYEPCKPIIKSNIIINGLGAESRNAGEKVSIIQKHFITSLQDDFDKKADNLIASVMGSFNRDGLNHLLIIIDEQNTAHIYIKFPQVLNIKTKTKVEAGSLFYKNQIADLESVEFYDSINRIKIQDGDKIIWLFRVNWRFGLYFDLSRSLTIKNLYTELGACYRSLLYFSTYAFLDNQKNFKLLLQDGWFPFFQLLGDKFDSLIQYYNESQSHF